MELTCKRLKTVYLYRYIEFRESSIFYTSNGDSQGSREKNPLGKGEGDVSVGVKINNNNN